MGRSTTSCFKIITCGSDSVDNDGVQASESKGSIDKRGWSFRKRSARHRVLSNTVISEVPSSLNKESSETATANLQTQTNTSFPEKTVATPWTDERSQLSTSVDLKLSETGVATSEDTMHDVNSDESIIIVIQAAVRGFLAQREMLKLKNLVKLQAAVRGHLVRRHAVGTLRCIQAIAKMQALVRDRRACLSSEGSYTGGKLDGNHAMDNHSSKLLEKGNSVIKPLVVYTSTEKLLSNKLARQLLESTPRTKHIHIKCDPSKSDSAWKWLERWMSVLSMGVEQPQKPESTMEQQEQDKNESSTCQAKTHIPPEGCESIDLKVNTMETTVPSQSEEKLITYDAENVDCEPGQPSSTSKIDNPEPQFPHLENSGMLNSKGRSLELLLNQTKQSDSISEMEIESIPIKPEMESEQPSCSSKPEMESEQCIHSFKPEMESEQTTSSGNPEMESEQSIHSIKSGMESEQSTCSVKRFGSEQVETEGKKLVLGTRKTTNPAFIAVQSKFEELSSTSNSARSNSSYNRDVGVESNSDAISSGMDNAIRTEETGLVENSVSTAKSVRSMNLYNRDVGVESDSDAISFAMDSAISTREIGLAENATLTTSRVKVGGSECGTELSISSTLDSPDRCEIGVMDAERQAELPDEGNSSLNIAKNLDIEANGGAAIPESDLFYSISVGPEKLDGPVNSVAAVDSLQEKQKVETNASNTQIELDSEKGRQPYKSSPEASPRSHMTVPEPQGTPSSQVSVKAGKTKSDGGASNKKRTSSSAGKRSIPNPSHDSGIKGSTEQLPKDHKTGKRRNSFGSGRPDYIDQEPRDSNCSLPNYMQATESARAKALANSSPRSSPDMHDKDIYGKKRHSLPGANGRQGSPRAQRSTSRSQQGAKGNGHPPERKWQR